MRYDAHDTRRYLAPQLRCTIAPLAQRHSHEGRLSARLKRSDDHELCSGSMGRLRLSFSEAIGCARASVPAKLQRSQ
jgi:hypothetical protein